MREIVCRTNGRVLEKVGNYVKISLEDAIGTRSLVEIPMSILPLDIQQRIVRGECMKIIISVEENHA